MNPEVPPVARRRLVLYLFAILVVIFVPLFLAFWYGHHGPSDDFGRLMAVGKNYYDKGEALKAIESFEKAVTLEPTHPDGLLNLANACLLAGQSEKALKYGE